MGKFLILFGVTVVVLGVVLEIFDEIPAIGKLPGDILIKKGSFTFYFPFTTSVIVSVILSFVFSFFLRK